MVNLMSVSNLTSEMFKKVATYIPKSQKAKKAVERSFLQSVSAGKVKDIPEFIKIGVNLNAVNEEQFTALHITAEKGDVPAAAILVSQKNINLDAQTKIGTTPLMIAVVFNSLEFVKLLLRNGANPNIKNYTGKTALHFAVAKMNLSIVSQLLAFKAKVNVIDCFDNTPLSLSVIEHPSKSIAKVLLKNGADPNLRSAKCHPLLLELCLNCKSQEVLRLVPLLIDFNADPNITSNISNQTALHMISITGYVPLAKVLIKAGARMDIKDVFGRSPLDVAIDHQHKDLIEFYKEARKYTLKEIKERDQDSRYKLKSKIASFSSLSSIKRKNKSVKFTEIRSTESDEEEFIGNL